MSNPKAPLLRTLVRSTYDLQKMRIQLGNRICAEWRAQNGQEDSSDPVSEDTKDTMKLILESYKTLTDGLVNLPTPKRFKGDKVIASYTMLTLVNQYVDMRASEKKHFRRLKNVLDDYPIWTEWLKGVKGVGEAMAGVIISEFDIHKATYPSSMFRYAGLDVVRNPDGTVEGRGKYKHHLEKQKYTDKEGNEKEKDGITFNPFLKTKLVGVLSSCILRTKGDNKYKTIYYDYKHRLEHMPEHKEKTKGHRHNMAVRYMIKLFIVDLYMKWREIEGLPVYGTYAEEKLGLKHKKAA